LQSKYVDVVEWLEGEQCLARRDRDLMGSIDPCACTATQHAKEASALAFFSWRAAGRTSNSQLRPFCSTHSWAALTDLKITLLGGYFAVRPGQPGARHSLSLEIHKPTPIFILPPLGTSFLLPQNVGPLPKMLVKSAMPILLRIPFRAPVLLPEQIRALPNRLV